MPSMQAPANPRRLMRRMQRNPRILLADGLTTADVPSGESSSTKMTSQAAPGENAAQTFDQDRNVGSLVEVGMTTVSSGRSSRPRSAAQVQSETSSSRVLGDHHADRAISARHQALVVAGGNHKASARRSGGRHRAPASSPAPADANAPRMTQFSRKEQVRIGCKLENFCKCPTLISTQVVITRLFSQECVRR